MRIILIYKFKWPTPSRKGPSPKREIDVIIMSLYGAADRKKTVEPIIWNEYIPTPRRRITIFKKAPKLTKRWIV